MPFFSKKMAKWRCPRPIAHPNPRFTYDCYGFRPKTSSTLAASIYVSDESKGGNASVSNESDVIGGSVSDEGIDFSLSDSKTGDYAFVHSVSDEGKDVSLSDSKTGDYVFVHSVSDKGIDFSLSDSKTSETGGLDYANQHNMIDDESRFSEAGYRRETGDNANNSEGGNESDQDSTEIIHQAIDSPAIPVDQESLFNRKVSPDLDVNAGLAVAQHASYTFGIQAEQGVDLSFVSPVKNRVCWVKLPSGGKMESIKWWPGLLYESFNEVIQDVGESSMLLY